MKAWISSNFGKFATELRPLIDVRIEILLNILKTNRPIKTKFCVHIIIFLFLIQFNVPFKIMLLIETSQSIGGRNGRTPGKPPDTPASKTWLVSHVASAGLEPTPDTAVST